MSDAQPPAGWYADPQDAQQQRYWDGTTWTGHTAPGAAAPASAPTGDAPQPAAPLPTGTPTWQMPVGGQAGMPGMPPAKKAWFKRKIVWIPGLIVLILIIAGVISVAVNGGDHSSGLEDAIRSQGQAQLQASVSKIDPGATAKITDVSCVEKGSSQQYDCQVHLTVTETSGTTEKFMTTAVGTCDSKINASCLWHATGSLVPDNSQ